jgi:hypothetical protein
MTISTLAQLLAAPKQKIKLTKLGLSFSTGSIWGEFFTGAGDPAPGSLAVGNTANGIVPVASDTGYPNLNTFGGGATGYISRLEYNRSSGSAGTGRKMTLFDCLFRAGTYSFGASQTLSSQPSYSARVPGTTDFKGTEIWLVPASNWTVPTSSTVTVTYTNEAGTAGRTTSLTTTTGLFINCCLQFPLAAGDQGVQKIESVVESGATAGTFNIHVQRPLAAVQWAHIGASMMDPRPQDFLTTGLPIVNHNAALLPFYWSEGGSFPVETYIEIVNG